MANITSILPTHAFEYLKQQLLCYQKMPAHYKVGLDIINMTNIDNYENHQRAELYYYKGEFYRKLGYHEKAKEAYCGAIGFSKDLDLGTLLHFKCC